MLAQNIAKQQRNERAKRMRARMLVVMGVVAVIGVLACGYGHAAVNSELYIEGDATVKATGTFNIKYMQEMEPVVCERTPIGTTEQVMDQRDGKSYWIAKLEDGNCYMTQDLALDITTAGLTSELTDLSYSDRAQYEEEVGADGEVIYKWNAGSKYPPVDTTTGPYVVGSSAATNDVLTRSTRPESQYVMVYPATVSAKADEKVATLAEVAGVQLQDVTGWKDTFKYDAETGMAIDPETKTYDAHYLIGNFYAANAAAAGAAWVTTNTTSHKTIESSICPKGWQLIHHTKNGANNTYNSIQQLVKMAGYTTKTPIAINGVNKDLAEPPYYLYRVGMITTGSKYYRVGQMVDYYTDRIGYGTWWTFRINKNTITADSDTSVSGGRTVRCMARME